ncbi:hypothetical protein NDU88_005101 [Pleurodeles waltl]|uniref:Uncharacterized protein n=1 Tax=Pleurodeles waltl TaxID=8319 RepID=A0AAV7NLR4_PLEWA|nr:hypothetical protein NDU88_005101 [Pleurodeles waltl]
MWDRYSKDGVEWEALIMVVRGHCMGQTVGIKQAVERDLHRLENRLHALDNAQGLDLKALHCLSNLPEEYAVALEKLRCHDHAEYMDRVHKEEGRAGRVLA